MRRSVTGVVAVLFASGVLVGCSGSSGTTVTDVGGDGAADGMAGPDGTIGAMTPARGTTPDRALDRMQPRALRTPV